MNSKYQNLLNELFNGEEVPSPETLMGLMNETMSFFQDIQKKLGSSNPEEQEAALQETMDIKNLLESKMKELCEKTGLTPDQLASLAHNPNTLAPETLKTIENAQLRFDPSQNTDVACADKKHRIRC